MKKRNFLCLLLIVLCIAALVAYRAADRVWTDIVAPEIQVPDDDLVLSVQEPRQQLLQGVSAFDDRDGNVTSSLIVEDVRLLDASTGRVSVTVAAFDRSGNVAKATREAVYADYESPRFSLDRAMVYTQNTGFDPLDDITASDDLDGDIAYRIRAVSVDDSSVNNVGTHRIRFKVSNDLGDTVEMELPVEVLAANTYNAQLELTDYIVYLEAGQHFSERDYLKSFKFATNSFELNGSLPNHFYMKTYGVVNTDVPGVYTISYKVTYDRTTANGFQSEDCIGYSKIVVVVEG